MTSPFVFIAAPDGTIRTRPGAPLPAAASPADTRRRLDAARARIRPPLIDPEAAIGDRAQAWLDQVDAEFADRNLAILAVIASMRASFGIRHRPPADAGPAAAPCADAPRPH